MNQILLGNCLDVLRTLKNNSVDAVITDPPYGLGNKEPTLDEIIAYLCGLSELDTGGDFKGADWFIPSVSVWRECYRVLKPGGHLLSFGGTRTHDLISMGLRAAGFHSRDTIQMLSWIQGQGFPKSTNIAKKIGLGTSESYSACEPTFRYDKPCECDQENQMDSRDGVSIGYNAGLSSSFENRTSGCTEESGSKNCEKTEISKNSCLQGIVDPKFGDSLRQLRQTDEKETALDQKKQKTILFEDLQLNGSEDSGYRAPSLRAGVEETKRRDSKKRQKLPPLREDSTGEQGSSTCTSFETLPLRGEQHGGEFSSSLREMSPQDRSCDYSDSNVSSNRSAATGRLPTDTGREDSDMGRRCVKCRRLKEKFYRHIESLGTSLKPSWEPILVFRKPLEGSVSSNVGKYGTGAYNIEGTRVGSRWPANVVFVHGPDCEVVGKKRVKAPVINRFDDGMKPFGEGAGHAYTSEQRGDSEGMEEILIYECQEGCPVKDLAEQNSSAPKFFAQFKYVKKANKRERGEGNDHPTVKPLDLMEWLVKLVSPEGGTVLDVYCGSGTTCLASKNLGRNFIGIERDPKFFEIATGRLQTMAKQD